MTSWQRLGARIGGPNAVTWWAWLVTLPLSVLISSVYATTPTGSEVLQWTSALVTIHLVLGLLMLLARFTFLNAGPRRARPISALAFFAILGLVRALLLEFAQVSLDLGFFDLSERIAFNIAASTAIYASLAIIIDEYKVDATITSNLVSAQASLEQLLTEEKVKLATLDEHILSEVQETVIHELNEHDVDGTRVREISDSIVRGLSHQLARSEEQDEWIPQRPLPPSGWAVVAHVLRRLRVPSPLLVVSVYQGLVIGTVIARIGLVFAAISVVLTSIPSYIGLTLMRRFLSLPTSGPLRLLVLTAGVTATGLIAGVTNAWIWRTLFEAQSTSVPAVAAGLVGLTLIISMWIAVSEGRTQRREQLSLTLNELTRETTRLQELVDERRRRAARFLHGNVQNQLVASAMRGDSPTHIQTAIVELFTSYGQEGHQGSARANFTRLLESWQSVLTIEANISSDIWGALERQDSRLALFTDVVSEGLTNAVRHSTGKSLRLDACVEGEEIVVRMRTQGTTANTAAPGIGLQELSKRGAHPRLQAEDDVTTLTVRL